MLYIITHIAKIHNIYQMYNHTHVDTCVYDNNDYSENYRYTTRSHIIEKFDYKLRKKNFSLLRKLRKF